MTDKPKKPYLVCPSCGHYPMKEEHAHEKCPMCGYRSTCCEGEPC